MVKKNIHIIGAGCAGLSLAKYLSMKAQNFSYKINFYGQKTKAFETPNYWSFWNGQVSLPNERLIKKKWFQWQIISEDSRILHRTDEFPYCAINSRDWLTFCGFEDIEINSDMPKPGPFVFDSRSPRTHSACLTQEFIGQTITLEKPLFDQDIVTLMDFRCDQSEGIHFIYILPFSSREALIESTRISLFQCSKEFYKNAINLYLKENLGSVRFKIVAEEYGKIPMGKLEKFEEKYLGIGNNGGCIRASSGYAFNAIQKQAQSIAKKITNGESINTQNQIPATSSRFEKKLDSIFLMALAKQPKRASEYFIKISKRLEGDEFARFMSGNASKMVLLKLICALPIVPFLQAWFYTIRADINYGNNND